MSCSVVAGRNGCGILGDITLLLIGAHALVGVYTRGPAGSLIYTRGGRPRPSSIFHPTFLLHSNPTSWRRRSADQTLQLEEVGRAKAGDLRAEEQTRGKKISVGAALQRRAGGGRTRDDGALTGSQPVPAVKPFVLQPGFEPDVMSLSADLPVE